MPFVSRDGVRIYWRADGRPNAPALLLGNSLGTDHSLWDPVLPALAARYRVIRFDKRGHGASEANAADYTIELLARDALAVADAAGAKRFHYAGISIGGMIGIWLGANAGDRVDRLILSNTSAKTPSEGWIDRIKAVREGGIAPMTEAVMQRWFTPAYLAGDHVALANLRRVLNETDPVGYIGCCAAIRDMDQRASLPLIARPTLVVTGTYDLATPKAMGEEIAAAVGRQPGQQPAQRVELPVGHIPPPEQPDRYLHALIGFLQQDDAVSMIGAAAPLPGTEPARFEAGMDRRRAMLGASYVDAARARTSPFTAEFQDLITRYAWGEIWTRPGIDAPTRRLVVMAQMIALGRWEEFRLHVKSGLGNELSEETLKELILQSAIYCGVPAGNTAFHHAGDVLQQIVEQTARRSARLTRHGS